jgi:hypothetical protein
MKNLCRFILLMGLTGSLRSHAGADGYVCKILQIQELNTSGELVNHKGAYSPLVGESFSIERATGKVTGHPFSNNSVKEIRVLNYGSTEHSYHHIAISHPPNIWITYLYVSEHAVGLEKPFWGASDGNKTFSGLCK